LRNAAALAAMLAGRGFALVEPSSLPFAEQVTLFAGAEEVVCLGGSALFNTVFCAPGTRVITIESSTDFIAAHAELLASLELDYGVIFGEQDMADTNPVDKNWTLDLARAAEVLDRFFEQ
jgi:capsular polysaccharide biosynthesis protein